MKFVSFGLRKDSQPVSTGNILKLFNSERPQFISTQLGKRNAECTFSS